MKKLFFAAVLISVLLIVGSAGAFEVRDELGDANLRVTLADEIIRINISIRCAVEVPGHSGTEETFSNLASLDGSVVVLRDFWRWNALGEGRSALSWGYMYVTREWFGDSTFTVFNPFVLAQVEQMRSLTPPELRHLLFLPDGSLRIRMWFEFWDPAVSQVAGHQVDKLFGCVPFEARSFLRLDENGKPGVEFLLDARGIRPVPPDLPPLPRVRPTLVPPPPKEEIPRSYL